MRIDVSLKGETIRPSKLSIRENVLNLRLKMDQEDRRNKSIAIAARATGLPAFKEARAVALYSPYKNEVMTETIHEVSVSEGKSVAYPKVTDKKGSMEFHIVPGLSCLKNSTFGIKEPDVHNPVPAGEIDLFFIPGVAFSEAGERIGYGSGYYDRYLKRASSRSSRVGLAFEFQVLDSLPSGFPDEKVDWIITEKRTIRANRAGGN